MKDKLSYLAIGDSYTIGESVPASESFPYLFVENIKKSDYEVDDVKIIAVTGWRTDELIAAIDNEAPSTEYDIVTLLIGVNNQYQNKPFPQYEEEFNVLLETAIKHANGVKNNVFVLSIPDYGFTPFGQKKEPAKITQELKRYNTYNRKASLNYGVHYVNITDISQSGLDEPSLIAEDGLHPSGTMYALWTERLTKQFLLSKDK